MVAAELLERTRRGVERWCTAADDPATLLEGVADRVRPIAQQDAGAWLVTDPATVLFTDGFVEGFHQDTCAPWYHHELAVEDVATFAQLARRRDRVAVLSEQTQGDPTTSARWRDVLEPAGFGRELRVVFRDGGATWGVATVHRATDEADFGPVEAALFHAIAPVVADGLRRVTLRREVARAGPEGPGLLLVRADGGVVPGTEAGARWLELLGLPSGAFQRTWLLTLGELVTGGGARPRRIRLRARDGRWVTLHAQPMTAPDAAFAVIVEPSRPAHIAAVIALAYGLSDRERELTLAVARGASTEELAASMRISTHTVRDHLKSIFDKTGVRSRAELVALLFHDHYADPMFRRLGARHP